MVIAIKVKVQNGKAFARVANTVSKFPDEMNDAGFAWLGTVVRRLKRNLLNNDNVWRGKLVNGIQARKKSKRRSVLFMPIEGTFLDSMKPHKVQLKKGRLIRKWALAKGNARVKRIAEKEGSIYVRPHPFFESAFQEAVIRLPLVLKRRADSIIARGVKLGN